MKEGLYYIDQRTDEVLLCHTFTRSSHVFINRNNVQIDRGKYNVYSVVKSKKIIAAFEANRSKYPNRKYIREPLIMGGWADIMAFTTIYANSSEVSE
ncbi:hypothetical protein [Paenibacillus sp. Leaf72]|uniref:hypothetical protein n=1 Tax=Paenibacillus sp. Leaf72 TaxID=1736234 RepID=UPI0006F6AF2A|nr:hypothetical protein [Paenibacillus sp. Leaf72]KQN96903.1 hypothetical protein ASF12_22810 [Paenibacillus sp. Leaf72]